MLAAPIPEREVDADSVFHSTGEKKKQL